MKEILPQLKSWSSKKLVLARVIQTWGSSPRPMGSCMLINEQGEMAGSVSGGCVEGAVVKESKNVFAAGSSKRLAYGVTDDDAWAVGLSCGGKIQVYIQPWPSNMGKKIVDLLSNNQTFVLVTSLVDGKSNNRIVTLDKNTFGDSVPNTLIDRAIDAVNMRNHESITIDEIEYFIHVFPRKSRMLIIGAAHITADLVDLARQFDFETIVIDPRKTFAQNTTFNNKPDQLIEKYPSEVLSEMQLDPYTYAVVLSHDPKIDDNALQILLRSPVAYIGALGSKKNHEKRSNRLMEKGFTQEEISKINAPIGLDINSVGAKEIALSILAAVIEAKNRNL